MLCTLQKLSMASAGEQPPQANDQRNDPLSENQANAMGTVFHFGLRATMTSYLLERLLMALAMQIVNDSMTVEGKFQYQKAKGVLDEVKKKCKKDGSGENAMRENLKKVLSDETAKLSSDQDHSDSLMKIEHWSNLMRRLFTMRQEQTQTPTTDLYMELLQKTEKLMDGSREEDIALLKKIKTLADQIMAELQTRQKKRQKELIGIECENIYLDRLLFTCTRKVIEQQLKKTKNPTHTLSPNFCKMIRVAAVHGECLRLNTPWYVFENTKVHGVLFHKDLVTVDKGNELIPQCSSKEKSPLKKPIHLIKYLFHDRNQASHPAETQGKTSSIEEFMKQLDCVDRLLDPYFDTADSTADSTEDKKNLKLLFDDCETINVIERIYTEMRNTYPNFQYKVMEKLIHLEGEKADLKKEVETLKDGQIEMDVRVWCLTIEWYQEGNECYKELLKMINKPEYIIRYAKGATNSGLLQELREAHHLDEVHAKQAVDTFSDEEEDRNPTPNTDAV